MITLKKEQSWYNPFFLNGILLRNIKFYKPDGTTLEVGRGWFGGSNNAIDELEINVLLPSSTGRRRKFKADGKAFVMKERTRQETGYTLYIPASIFTWTSKSRVLEHGETQSVYMDYTANEDPRINFSIYLGQETSAKAKTILETLKEFKAVYDKLNKLGVHIYETRNLDERIEKLEKELTKC